MTHDFSERLRFSMGRLQASDTETILAMIPGCVSVAKSSGHADRAGIDYVATLRGGATVLIDAKNRDKGCKRFWIDGEPELALELWSVRPNGKYNTPKERARTGWTLREDTQVDLLLFKFDPADTRLVYLLSYQLLRGAFRANLADWKERFGIKIQDSKTWESEAVMVPAFMVFDAINRFCVSTQPKDPPPP